MLQDAHAKGLLENKFEYGGDFGSPDETYISSQFDRPVMVHRYPAEVKAFYMEPDPTGRTSRYASMCSHLRAMARLSADRSAWRLTSCCSNAFMNTGCRKKRSSGTLTCANIGGVPHAGFGMGIERAVAWICGLEHVRETIPFPRMLYRLYP